MPLPCRSVHNGRTPFKTPAPLPRELLTERLVGIIAQLMVHVGLDIPHGEDAHTVGDADVIFGVYQRIRAGSAVPAELTHGAFGKAVIEHRAHADAVAVAVLGHGEPHLAELLRRIETVAPHIVDGRAREDARAVAAYAVVCQGFRKQHIVGYAGDDAAARRVEVVGEMHHVLAGGDGDEIIPAGDLLRFFIAGIHLRHMGLELVRGMKSADLPAEGRRNMIADIIREAFTADLLHDAPGDIETQAVEEARPGHKREGSFGELADELLRGRVGMRLEVGNHLRGFDVVGEAALHAHQLLHGAIHRVWHDAVFGFYEAAEIGIELFHRVL